MSKENKGTVRMTVIHFETESDNSTLQANISAIAQTLSRALVPPRMPPNPAQLGNGNAPNRYEADSEPFLDDAIDAEFIPTPPKKPKGSSGGFKSRSPKVLDNLEFTSGDIPLRTFFDEKNPRGENKKYLTIAYWFKQHRNIEEVTMDHIHSAYRFLGLNTPKDAGKPLRNLKVQDWMSKGSSQGGYMINHIGENEINDLGK